MSTKDVMPPVNSRCWWEDYFAEQWDAYGGRAQTAYFMRRLVEHLPAAEREYLNSRDASILDWGCAFGNGVDVLAQTFPRCSVSGLDFAETAIAEAKSCFPQYEFHRTDNGEIPKSFDVVVVSNCLEHFPNPLEVMRRQLPHCRKFYAVLVPYRESPLHSSHVSQFREECFPHRFDGFTRIATVIIDCESPYWLGRQILVLYASGDYLREREEILQWVDERDKWDHIYAAISPTPIDGAVQEFGRDLAARIQELLPEGGRVLEAGCGAGWQSLALAKAGRYDLTLMDFSRKALEYAEHSFAQQGASAGFVCEDVFTLGKPEHDLVFNAGVLEHYAFDKQVDFLRGMASRSRKYVLALVPNRMCYWYWLWRMQKSSRDDWPYGKEIPMTDLSAAFETAGMRFLGHWFGGGAWSELFIRGLHGIEEPLREEILAVHRSNIIPEHQRSYLVAALGCTSESATAPVCWMKSGIGEDFSIDQITSAMADAMAVALAAQRRETSLHRRVAELTVESGRLDDLKREAASLRAAVEQKQNEMLQQSEQLARQEKEMADLSTIAEQHRRQLEAIERSRAWAVANFLRTVRRRLLPPGSVRESAARLPWRAVKRLRTPRTTCLAAARAVFRRLPLSVQYRLRSGWAAAHRWRLPSNHGTLRHVPSIDVPGLVSVVLPVYNHAAMLRGAVESVLAQTYRDFELILVNDGSTDGVEAVLAEYARHPRVRILTQANQKLPKALSNGFEFAQGEFWTWTSADNLMHPEQLARLVGFLRANREVGMVFADYTAIDPQGRPLTDPSFRPHNRRAPHDPEIHLPHDLRLFGENADNFIGPCFLYRSWAGRLVGEYDPILGIEDFDYWLRLSLVAPIAHLDSDEPLYRYRVHENSLSGRAEELQIPQHARKLIDYHRDRKAFHAKPWTIHADAATLSWLKDIDVRPHVVAEWSGEPLEPDAEGKSLLLVHAASLESAVEGGGSGAVPIAAWFPDDVEAFEQYRAESHRMADLCFAADDATAARLRLLTPQVFKAAPGAAMVDLATKWANGRLFYEATRDVARRARSLPRVLRPENPGPHVLLQADSFTQGGMEQVVIDVAKSLRADRFEVSLLVLGEQGSDAERMRQAGFSVVRLPKEDREGHYRRLLKERRIDVVNAHYSLFGASAAAQESIPFVQTIHNTYIFLPPHEVLAYQANDPFTSAYICVSQAAAHYSDTKLGLPASKMVLVPNGIDLGRLDEAAAANPRSTLRNELGLANDDYVFLNVGSLQPIKCQATLVNAFAPVARLFPEAKLVFVGRAMNAAYLEEVRRAVARHGLERAVLLAGHREDVARFYWASDAFMLPSLCEGWSLALAEAIAAGLPVVATSVGSAPDVLPRLGGRLVRPPFGAITNLDAVNLSRYTTTEDPQFVEDLTAALADLCQKRTRPLVSESLRRSLDCRETYKPYGELFLWLMQGGHPAMGRSWAAGRFASSLACSRVKTVAA